MGWIMHSKPGTDDGPCASACKHKDCQATREDAAAKCRWCGNPIGYESKFYMDKAPTASGWSYIHFLCALKRAETINKNVLTGLNG
jgi:hypothetical protein